MMAIVELADICKDYQQGKEPVRVLKNINLTVEQGEYLAIMGPSGSGKTTLMNLIGCLDVPTSGTFVLDGKDLKDLNDDQLTDIRSKYIGFVFQGFHLLPKMDALDNVALPLLYAGVSLKDRRERAAEALKAVGLEDRGHRAQFGRKLRDILTVHPDGTFIRHQETADHIQCGRLTAAGGAKNAEQLAFFQRQIQIRDDFLAVKLLFQMG
jgi:ABC-type multidrug transport system ATPase subunit